MTIYAGEYVITAFDIEIVHAGTTKVETPDADHSTISHAARRRKMRHDARKQRGIMKSLAVNEAAQSKDICEVLEAMRSARHISNLYGCRYVAADDPLGSPP